jgi:hypothetical protein
VSPKIENLGAQKVPMLACRGISLGNFTFKKQSPSYKGKGILNLIIKSIYV